MVAANVGAVGALIFYSDYLEVIMSIAIGSNCQEIIPLSDSRSCGLTGAELADVIRRAQPLGYRVHVVDMSNCPYGAGSFAIALGWRLHADGFVLAAPFGLIRNFTGTHGRYRSRLYRHESPRLLPFLEERSVYDSLVLCNANLTGLGIEGLSDVMRLRPDTCALHGHKLADAIADEIAQYRDRRQALSA